MQLSATHTTNTQLFSQFLPFFNIPELLFADLRLFSYASSSTLYPCQWVSKWAEFRTSIASRLASLFFLILSNILVVKETCSVQKISLLVKIHAKINCYSWLLLTHLVILAIWDDSWQGIAWYFAGICICFIICKCTQSGPPSTQGRIATFKHLWPFWMRKYL